MFTNFNLNEILLISLISILNIICYINLEKISKIFNLYDYPDEVRKLHKNKTPLLGGIFIYFSIVLYILIIPNISKLGYEYLYLYSYKSIIFFIICLTSIFVLGFLDDKFTISPDKKLVVLFLICYIYVISDNTVRIEQIRFDFINLEIDINKFSPILSSIFIITFIILSNMFDGIDGQSSFFFIFTLLILILINPAIIKLLIFLILLLIIFFYFNTQSKIFLGDNGIFVLSFIISILYLKTYNIYGNLSFDKLILISFFPLLDMIRVSLLRIFNGRNPMRPDTTHLHHIIKFKNTKLLIISLLVIYPFAIYYFLNSFILSIVSSFILYIILIFKKS